MRWKHDGDRVEGVDLVEWTKGVDIVYTKAPPVGHDLVWKKKTHDFEVDVVEWMDVVE